MDEKYIVSAFYPHYLYEAKLDTLTEAETEFHKIIQDTESPFGKLIRICILWGNTIIKESEV